MEDDADGAFQDEMKDALATLKQASGGKADFLYELPWYIIIGPPGSGKTTALLNSGLKFPLAAKLGTARRRAASAARATATGGSPTKPC